MYVLMFHELITRLQGKIKLDFEVERMEPLFENQKAYDEFTKRHNTHNVANKETLSAYQVATVI